MLLAFRFKLPGIQNLLAFAGLCWPTCARSPKSLSGELMGVKR
jgi:hypothetical protein